MSDIDADKEVEPRIKGVQWYIFREMPGLFPKGSGEDRDFLQRSKDRAAQGQSVPDGRLFEVGLFSPTEISPWVTSPYTHGSEDAQEYNDYLDAESMTELDARLRIFRAIISYYFAVVWTDRGEPVWDINDPPAGDPLECICHEFELDQPSQEPVYFALKALRHFRRFEEIAEQGVSAFHPSAMRELMLFGETWATARAVQKLGQDFLTGKPVRAGSSKGGEEKARLVTNPARNAVLAEMQRLLASRPTGGIAWAAQQAHKNGLGASGPANRQAYYRHRRRK